MIGHNMANWCRSTFTILFSASLCYSVWFMNFRCVLNFGHWETFTWHPRPEHFAYLWCTVWLLSDQSFSNFFNCRCGLHGICCRFVTRKISFVHLEKNREILSTSIWDPTLGKSYLGKRVSNLGKLGKALPSIPLSQLSWLSQFAFREL